MYDNPTPSFTKTLDLGGRYTIDAKRGRLMPWLDGEFVIQDTRATARQAMTSDPLCGGYYE
jgi:hypothetical protein